MQGRKRWNWRQYKTVKPTTHFKGDFIRRSCGNFDPASENRKRISLLHPEDTLGRDFSGNSRPRAFCTFKMVASVFTYVCVRLLYKIAQSDWLNYFSFPRNKCIKSLGWVH